MVVEGIDVTATFMCRCVAVDRHECRHVMRTVVLLIC